MDAKLTDSLGDWLGRHRNRMVGGYKLKCELLPVKGNPRGWYVQTGRGDANAQTSAK